MEILKMHFEKSAAKPAQFITDSLPKVVITGKSNVGKSSLINSVGNNGKLARTSSTPGKTRLVNYFLADDAFYIVDLPGYGFALAPKSEQQQWQDLMDGFFRTETTKKALMLVDIRHKPTAEDILMRDYLTYYGFRTVVVATKADKVAKTKVNNYLSDIKKELSFPADTLYIPFSSDSGLNRDLLVKTIKNFALSDQIGMQ